MNHKKMDLNCTSKTWSYRKTFLVTSDGVPVARERMNDDWLRRLHIFNREEIVRAHKWAFFDTMGIIQFNVEVDLDSVISMLMCIYGGPVTATPLDYSELSDFLIAQQRLTMPFGFYPNLFDFNAFLRIGELTQVG